MVLKATLQKESPKWSLPKVTSEAAVRICSSKYAFLEMSQYSQENSVLKSLFNKVAGLAAGTQALGLMGWFVDLVIVRYLFQHAFID